MRAAWEWLKKYWQVVAGALLVLLGVGFGVAIQRRRPVPKEPNPVEEEANEEAEAQTRQAENEAADDKAKAQEEHDVDLAVVVDKVQDATAAVRGDADKTNAYLKNVGKDIRGEDP